MIRCLILTAMLATSPVAFSQDHAQGDTFLKGPERTGHSRDLAGKVIGVHRDLQRNCYIIQADRPTPGWEGLGGGGRFFLCTSESLSMGHYWKGHGVQEGTRLHRMGPRRRVLPLFVPQAN